MNETYKGLERVKELSIYILNVASAAQTLGIDALNSDTMNTLKHDLDKAVGELMHVASSIKMPKAKK